MLAFIISSLLLTQADKQAEYDSQAAAQREAAIKSTTAGITWYSQHAKDRRKSPQARKNAQDELKRLGTKLRDLKDKDKPYTLRLYLDSLAIGNMGIPRYPDEVIGADKERFPIGTVRQVIDGSNMLVEAFGTTLWIKGISTKGITDDNTISLNTTLECTDTKTYGTAIGGSKTVMVLEPFEPQSQPVVKPPKR